MCNVVGAVPYRDSMRQRPDNPEGKCQLDHDRLPAELPTDPAERRSALYEAGLCDVCQMFGATGWRRQFRISIDGRKLAPDGPLGTRAARRSYSTRDAHGKVQEKVPKWYFKPQARGGSLRIHLVPVGSEDVSRIVAGLLQFVADWAALGARSQLGFGVVHLPERVDGRSLYDRIALAAGDQASHYGGLPSLGNLFFARVTAPNGDWEAVLDLKYDLRQLLAGSTRRRLRHSLFGTAARDQRLACKVKVSAPHGDPPVMRIWGWVPDGDQPTSSVPAIYSLLKSIDTSLTWRELSSPRDTVREHRDPLEFLADLLEVTS